MARRAADGANFDFEPMPPPGRSTTQVPGQVQGGDEEGDSGREARPRDLGGGPVTLINGIDKIVDKCSS